jgi:hypothetical protein
MEITVSAAVVPLHSLTRMPVFVHRALPYNLVMFAPLQSWLWHTEHVFRLSAVHRTKLLSNYPCSLNVDRVTNTRADIELPEKVVLDSSTYRAGTSCTACAVYMCSRVYLSSVSQYILYVSCVMFSKVIEVKVKLSRYRYAGGKE